MAAILYKIQNAQGAPQDMVQNIILESLRTQVSVQWNAPPSNNLGKVFYSIEYIDHNGSDVQATLISQTNFAFNKTWNIFDKIKITYHGIKKDSSHGVSFIIIEDIALKDDPPGIGSLLAPS